MCVDKSTFPHHPSLPSSAGVFVSSSSSSSSSHLFNSSIGWSCQSAILSHQDLFPWRAIIIRHLRHSRRRFPLRRQGFLQRMSGDLFLLIRQYFSHLPYFLQGLDCTPPPLSGHLRLFLEDPRLWQRPQQLWRCVLKFSLSHWLLIYLPEATLCGSLCWTGPSLFFRFVQHLPLSVQCLSKLHAGSDLFRCGGCWS